MKVTLPVVVKNEYDTTTKTHFFETQEREFEFDFSLCCQMKWEARFPELAKRETIVDYTARISKLPSSVATLLSKMKAVYCFISGEYLSFEGFVKMFDFTRKDYVQALTARLREVLALFEDEATEKN